MDSKYLTVTQLTKYIKFKIDNDPNLMNVFLKGEISNFKAHTRGHLYFTIKDENTRINAIMFVRDASKLNFVPIDGMKVMVTGRISVFESTGQYQIYVNEMIEDGIGNLYIEFEKLKKKLASEGLFDSNKKKPIPKFPKKIGIVTASTGAAIRDILTTLKRRWPLTEVILFPSLVQGELAAKDIVRQIEKANTYDIDTLIVGRGGGSIEDLWPFNEEIVARAIYNSKVPVISGVGHEIDFTISDFVSDMRAATPTAAAELAVPNLLDIINHINQIELRLTNDLNNKLNLNKSILNRIKESYIFKNPINIYLKKEEQYSYIYDKLKINIINLLNNSKNKYEIINNSYIFKNPEIIYKNKQDKYVNLLQKLELLNPVETIKRGYSITKKDKKVISSIKNINKDDILTIELTDGSINAKVI